VPDEIAAMQGLRVLEGLGVYTQSVEFLEGPGQLKNLSRLGILFMNSDCDDDWEEKQEKAASSICDLGKAELESLHIYIHEEQKISLRSGFPVLHTAFRSWSSRRIHSQ
jgi:disease resistance protein RPM1